MIKIAAIKRPLVIDLTQGRIGAFIGLKPNPAAPNLVHPVILPLNKFRNKKNYYVFPETFRQEAIITVRPPVSEIVQTATLQEYIIITEDSNGKRPFFDSWNNVQMEKISKLTESLRSKDLEIATQKYKSDKATEESSKKLQDENERKITRQPQNSFGNPFGSPYPMTFDERMRMQQQQNNNQDFYGDY